MNKIKIGYYLSTGLLSAMMCMSAGMYIFNHEEIAKVFALLGYPIYIIYPLALAKTLGLIAIWTRKSKQLLYLAYAGFFYNFLLAFSAHIAINDGEHYGAALALVLLAASYTCQKKVFTD